jgi:hypothetical protein
MYVCYYVTLCKYGQCNVFHLCRWSAVVSVRLEFCKLSLKISSSEAAPTPSYRIYAWICWIEILKDKEMICNVATMAAASRYKYQGAIGTRCRFKFTRRSKGLEFLQEFLSSTAAFSATMCHKRCGEQTIHNFLVETFEDFSTLSSGPLLLRVSTEPVTGTKAASKRENCRVLILTVNWGYP